CIQESANRRELPSLHEFAVVDIEFQKVGTTCEIFGIKLDFLGTLALHASAQDSHFAAHQVQHSDVHICIGDEVVTHVRPAHDWGWSDAQTCIGKWAAHCNCSTDAVVDRDVLCKRLHTHKRNGDISDACHDDGVVVRKGRAHGGRHTEDFHATTCECRWAADVMAFRMVGITLLVQAIWD